MEQKISYQYTYFIYPFVIKEENYASYIRYLLKSKKYEINFFNSYANENLYQYFTTNVQENLFQRFSFLPEKITKFKKQTIQRQLKILLQEKCLMFDYIIEKDIQGKLGEIDGIFFTVPKIELICFHTGICFLLIKTHLSETASFSDLLNFNHSFANIANLKQNIKLQGECFSNMETGIDWIKHLIGQNIKYSWLEKSKNTFLVYTYACVDALSWNKDHSFENFENEFIKLADLKESNSSAYIDKNKFSILSNAPYMKIRLTGQTVALICSATDSFNYTKLADMYENEYLYTYLIALHQKYDLKKVDYQIQFQKPKKVIQQMITFIKQAWISDITEDIFGQQFYYQCKRNIQLDELFYEVKSKYDVFYKQKNIENHKISNTILTIAFCLSLAASAFSIYFNIFLK